MKYSILDEAGPIDPKAYGKHAMPLNAMGYLFTTLDEGQSKDRLEKIVQFLKDRDAALSAQDGDVRDTLEGCEEALRAVFLIATTGKETEG